MAKLTVRNSLMDIDVTYPTEDHLLMNNVAFVLFIDSVQSLHNIVVLDTLTIDKKDGFDDIFDFSFKSHDNRHWKQVVKLDQESNPDMSFDVNDYWRKTEIDAWTNARTKAIDLINAFNVTKIKVKILT